MHFRINENDQGSVALTTGAAHPDGTCFVKGLVQENDFVKGLVQENDSLDGLKRNSSFFSLGASSISPESR